MPIQRKYDFQPGTKIASSHLDEEFNQLIAQLNQVEADDMSKDQEIRANAQMNKVTTDTGAAKLNINDATKDLLQELFRTNVGFQTFYAVAGTKNSPLGSGSIRGIFHQTSPGHGWVMAIDYVNNLYTNYVAANVWTGWKKYNAVSDGQETLWTGSAYMGASSTVTPTKKISDCRNGWVLIWSDYDPDVGARNWDFQTTTILKEQVAKYPGASMTIPIAFYHDSTTVGITAKTLYIHNDKIVGHIANDSAANNTIDVCLRNVIEF